METYALVHEGGELALILNLDELLAAVGRVGDVQLVWSVMVRAGTNWRMSLIH